MLYKVTYQFLWPSIWALVRLDYYSTLPMSEEK